MKKVTSITKNKTQAKTTTQAIAKPKEITEKEAKKLEIQADMTSMEEALEQQKITLRALQTGMWAAQEVTNTAKAQSLTATMVTVITSQLSELKKTLRKSGGKKTTAKKKAKKGTKKK